MGRKKGPLEGKLRTREHVVADLAVNHVERQVLLCGWTVERVQRDYGVDLLLFTYTDGGEMEPGPIYLQVKGTEQATWIQSGREISFRLERTDLIGWLRETIPVILVVYEATAHRAFWLHVQDYFAALPDFNLFRAGRSIRVHLPIAQPFDLANVRLIRALRDTASAATP